MIVYPFGENIFHFTVSAPLNFLIGVFLKTRNYEKSIIMSFNALQ